MSTRDLNKLKRHAFLCEGKVCHSHLSEELSKAFKEKIKDLDLKEQVQLTRTQCLGQCDHGPVMAVYPEGVWYQKVELKDVEEIVSSHFRDGTIINDKLLYKKDD